MRRPAANVVEYIHRAARAPAVGVSLLVLTSAARAEPRAASLSWVRHAGAESCPGPSAVANAVETRLGAHVLAPASAPDLAVEAYVEPAPPVGYHVVVAVSDPQGRVIGRRELSSADADCAAAAESAELAIALMIDPEAHASAPVALPRMAGSAPTTSSMPAVVAPPASPVLLPPQPPLVLSPPPEPEDRGHSTPPRRFAWSAAVQASAAFTAGLLPGVAPGVRFAARMPIYDDRLALSAGASYYPEKRQEIQLSAAGPRVASTFQAVAVHIGACVLPDGGRARMGVIGCLGTDLGSMAIRTNGIDTTTGATGWIVDLDVRAHFVLRPLRGVLLFVGGALRLALSRERFEVVDSSGAPNPVFSRHLVGAEPEIGAGYEF
jgi:hypothetical protein